MVHYPGKEEDDRRENEAHVESQQHQDMLYVLGRIADAAERIAAALEHSAEACGRTRGEWTCGRTRVHCKGYHRDFETGSEWFDR